MRSRRPKRKTPPGAPRRVVETLLLLFLLFILITGIAPLQWEANPTGAQSDFFTSRMDRITRVDAIFNVFLYVPLGLLASVTFLRWGMRTLLSFLLSLLLAAVMSFSIEWLQGFMPARVSSLIDLCANITGAGLGALISLCGVAAVPRFVGALLYELHDRPRIAIIKCWVFVLIIAAMIPFSIAWDPPALRKALSQANFVPFATAVLQENHEDPAVDRGAYLKAEIKRWQVMRNYARWMLEACSFAVLAWLLLPALIEQFSFKPATGLALTVWSCGLLAVLLSALQLLVMTRGFDVSDIIARLTGMIAALCAVAVRNSSTKPVPPQPNTVMRRIGLGLAVAYIAYCGILPLNLDAGAGSLLKGAASEEFIPFIAYFQTRPDVMLSDLAQKFAAYLVFGALYAAAMAETLKRMAVRMCVAAGVGVMLALALEIVQGFMHVRVMSLTDPVIAAVACMLGVVFEQQAILLYRFARTHKMHGPPDRSLRMGPVDELVSTLVDPHPLAPREKAPRKRRRRTRI